MSKEEVKILLVNLIKDYVAFSKSVLNTPKIKKINEEYDKLTDLHNNKVISDEEYEKESGKINADYSIIIKELLDEFYHEHELSDEKIYQLLSSLDEIMFNEAASLSAVSIYDASGLLYFLIDKMTLENHEYYNELLKNDDFIDTVLGFHGIIGEVVKNSTSEESAIYVIRSMLDVSNKSRLNDILKSIFESNNYSLEFKQSLILNDEILNNIEGSILTNAISKNNFSKNTKLELIKKQNIISKLEKHEFTHIIASTCSSYDEAVGIINDPFYKEKIDVPRFIQSVNLDFSDTKKIITDVIGLENIDGYTLANIIEKSKGDFLEKKNFLFNDEVFKKIDSFGLSIIISSKNITTEEMLELLHNDKVMGLKRKLSEVLDKMISQKKSSIEGKVAIASDPTLRKYLSSSSVSTIMNNPNVPIEVSDSLLFDRELLKKFSRVESEEKLQEYYEFIEKLYQKNPMISKTFSYELLREDILNLDIDFLEKIVRYKDVTMMLVDSFEEQYSSKFVMGMIKAINNSEYSKSLNSEQIVEKVIDLCSKIKYFSLMPETLEQELKSQIRNIIKEEKLNVDKLTDEDWKVLTEIGFREKSVYNKGFKDFFAFSIMGMDNRIPIDSKLNILPEINSNEDLSNFFEKRMMLCDEAFIKAVNEKNLYEAKNAFFNKYFSINIEEAEEINRLYGSSIDEFFKESRYDRQTKYIMQVIKVLNIEKINTLVEIYNNKELIPITFDEIIYMDQAIRTMFSEKMSESVYKVTDMIIDSNGNKVSNAPHYMEFVIEKDGVKQIKKVPVYEPGFDFKLLINSTAAYGKMELINDNYFDSWNKSTRVGNHGICCSLISNDNMGMAQVNDVLLGFDGWGPQGIIKSSPYDIFSVNDSYNIMENRPLIFKSPQDIIDCTRHTHNEQVLERLELRSDRRNSQFPNIQPSYVIIYSDMVDEIKARAIKCSEEMNIPIVYLDKEKIVKNEVRKIDKKIELMDNTSDFNEKLVLFEQILTSHENNRSGIRMTNPRWVDMYFPSSKIENVIEKMILELQKTCLQTHDISSYYNFSSKLINILDNENKKFDETMENLDRINVIDIPILEYHKKIVGFLCPDLCLNNVPKLKNIVESYESIENDLEFTQIIKKIDYDNIYRQINDAVNKNLYPQNEKNHNLNHIEKVILFSQMIGMEELKNENGEVDLHYLNILMEAAKYHDCGRESDYKDKKHGEKGANKMKEMLVNDGFSAEDISIMQVAVEYHEKNDDETIFMNICKKYNIDETKIEITRKIVNCLKDADALDRTRFKNNAAKLNPEKLRFDFSKKLIKFANEINNRYSTYDVEFFKRRYYEMLYNQSVNNSVEHELQEGKDL